MTCREVDAILIDSGNSAPLLESEAAAHVHSCERCRRMGVLMEGTESAGEFDPKVLEMIGARLLPVLKPVRPLAPTWVWIGAFVLLAAAIAVIGASVLGMHGFWAATWRERTVILSAIGLGAFAAAAIVAREMSPGKKQQMSAGAVLTGSVVLILLGFSTLFRNDGIADFVHSGIPCLASGLCFAAGTALLVALLMRSGVILDQASAGMAVGTLAGWAGLCLLELHCTNLNAAHLIVWHAAVLAVSGTAGWLIGHTIKPGYTIKPA